MFKVDKIDFDQRNQMKSSAESFSNNNDDYYNDNDSNEDIEVEEPNANMITGIE
jgi:hypothetical protein